MMKKIIPYLIILLLAIVVYYLLSKGDKIVYLETGSTKIDTVYQDRWIDSQGRNHSVIETDGVIKTPEQIAAPNRPSGPIDTAAKALNIAVEQIRQLTAMKIQSEARALKAEKLVDSLKRTISFKYTGKYLSVIYHPVDSTTQNIYPNGRFDYMYTSELQWVKYHKQKKILGIPFGNKKCYTDFFLADTNAYIAPGMTRITVNEQLSKWAGHVQASSKINLATGAYGFGPAAQVDFGRLTLQYQYLYYPMSDRWTSNINLNFDAIKF